MILAAGTGSGEESKVARMRTGNFKIDGEPQVLFVFSFAAKAKPAVADWLRHPSRGGGERTDFRGA